MTRTIAALLTVLVGACGPADADYDGISAKDDCDDSDPLVYPGAPDQPGDGIDADCDGNDPEYSFVGEWQIVDMSALFSSFQVLVPRTAVGAMTVDLAETCELEVNVELDPEISPLPVDVLMSGSASALPGDGLVQVDLEGMLGIPDVYEEQSNATWRCEVTDDEQLECAGVLKALDANLDAWALFERD